MVPVLLQQEFITSNSGILPQRPQENITFYTIFGLFFIVKIFYLLDEDNNWGLNMSELKKKLDGAGSHCLPRALVLINPGNLTGTLSVYLFVITCNNSNEDDDDDDDGNDNKISLFTLDIVLAHSLQVSAFELSFHGVPLIKGCSLYQGVSYIGVLFAGVFFFSFFLMNSSLYRDVHYLGSR